MAHAGDKTDQPELAPQLERHDTSDVKKILIGVSGGSASGKSYFCNKIISEIFYDGRFNVLIVSMDDFYKGLSPQTDARTYNFDDPRAIDFEEAYSVLCALVNGMPAEIPIYSFVTHQRLPNKRTVKPADIILFEGIFALHDERIRNLMNLKIFMHCDDDIRLCRRLIRDQIERGRDIKSILQQYNRFVKPSNVEFVNPQMNFADLIVPGNRDNQIAVDLLIHELKTQAKQIGLYRELIKKDAVFVGDVIDPSLIQREDMQYQQRKYNPSGSSNSNNSSSITSSNQAPPVSASEKTASFKFMFVPLDDDDKMELLHQWGYFKKQYTAQRRRDIFQQMLRISMRVFEKIAQCENISLDSCGTILLQDFIDARAVQAIAQSDKEVFILVVPIIVVSQNHPEFSVQLRQALKQFKTHAGSKQLVIINFFGKMAVLNRLSTFQPALRNVVNCLCIGKVEKFVSALNDNFAGEQKQALDPYMHQKAMQQFVQDYLNASRVQQNLD